VNRTQHDDNDSATWATSSYVMRALDNYHEICPKPCEAQFRPWFRQFRHDKCHVLRRHVSWARQVARRDCRSILRLSVRRERTRAAARRNL